MEQSKIPQLYGWKALEPTHILAAELNKLTSSYQAVAPERGVSSLTDLEKDLKNTIGHPQVEWMPMTDGPILWAMGAVFFAEHGEANKIRLLFPFLSKINGPKLERPIAIYTRGQIAEPKLIKVLRNLEITFHQTKQHEKS